RMLTGGNWLYRVNSDGGMVEQIMHALYRLRIQSMLVEGGAQLLQSFISENRWDEARVITNGSLVIPGGIPAPRLTNGVQSGEERFFADRIVYYRHSSSGG
ncbi:MAG TPA: dihydrofolate reductase family protein, partial [Agriterribacter sp.]|nr:dihydrofolate reductase family protein [Agriterribacter sp.]